MKPLHDWDLTPPEAVKLQNELRSQVVIQPLETQPRLVAGADISFGKYSEVVYAGIVVLSFPELEIVEECGVTTKATFPYVPGLLSFREIPPLLQAWQKLKHQPDVLVLDGQGLAHPRRFGVACHMGLQLQIPTIGCAKSLLVGTFGELAPERGAHADLVHRGEVVGAALRTKNKVSPVYVSPGHLCDFEGALSLMLACDGGYRIPEPTRRAHLFVNRLRVAAKDS